MHPTVKKIIDQLKNYNPEKIILFGSYAHGKPKADSDVDLLVIKTTADSFLERQKKIHMLLKTIIPVDVFVFTPQEFETGKMYNLFVKEAVQTGKIVYGQE